MLFRLNHFGHAPLCNLHPERAIRIGSFVFPLCARCTGLIGGSLISISVTALGLAFALPFTSVIALTIPLAIDGLLQYFGLWMSTNTRRLVTGLLFGFAITQQEATITLW